MKPEIFGDYLVYAFSFVGMVWFVCKVASFFCDLADMAKDNKEGEQ